jgi:hypothetical protein
MLGRGLAAVGVARPGDAGRGPPKAERNSGAMSLRVGMRGCGGSGAFAIAPSWVTGGVSSDASTGVGGVRRTSGATSALLRGAACVSAAGSAAAPEAPASRTIETGIGRRVARFAGPLIESPGAANEPMRLSGALGNGEKKVPSSMASVEKNATNAPNKDSSAAPRTGKGRLQSERGRQRHGLQSIIGLY